MNVSLIAERYANALFELSLEKNMIEKTLTDARVVLDICTQNHDLQLFFRSPIIYSDKKITIIRKIFSESVSNLMLTFMLVLIRKRREQFIPEIAKRIIEQIKEYKNILTVYFRAPVEPDSETRKKILEVVNQYSKADVELVGEIDEALIGGFVLSWKDKQYDASISRQLDQLKRDVTRFNLYLKGF